MLAAMIVGLLLSSWSACLLTCVRVGDAQLPHMSPFPGPRSVLILDGCGIHHTLEVLDAVHSIGGLVVFLEPYDPQHMPIELGFRAMKAYLRRNRQHLAHLPLDEQLREASRRVSSSVGRSSFAECGYFVNH